MGRCFIIDGVVNEEEFFGFPDDPACADYDDYYDYYFDDSCWDRDSYGNKDKPKRPLGSYSWSHKTDGEPRNNVTKDLKRNHHKSNSQNKRNKKHKNEKRLNEKNNDQKNKKSSNPNKGTNKRQSSNDRYPVASCDEPCIAVSTV